MPYVSPEAIMQAKKMDLLTYLQNYEPQELVRIDSNTYSTKTHDSLKISNGKWCWFSRGIGGRSALDYLIKVKELSFVKAVERIVGQVTVASSVFYRQEKNCEINKPEKILFLPERNDNNERVNIYLSNRGIHQEIIDYCIRNNLFYEQKDHHNVVFIGYDTRGIPRYGVLRGIGETRFLGEVLGSDKRFSFFIPAKTKSDILHLFESAIDLLSYVSLELIQDRDWQAENYLSLAGVYKPKIDGTPMNTPIALSQYLQDRPHIKTIKLHLDNDYIGRAATKALISSLEGSHCIIDEPPLSGKDCNDQLRNLIGIKSIRKEVQR